MIIILQVVMCGKPRNMKELRFRNDRQIEGTKKAEQSSSIWQCPFMLFVVVDFQ